MGSYRLTGRPAVFLLASVVVALLASSAAPTPLYAIYQTEWHFTPITTTVVFGVHAIAVLAALLVLGKLSDHVGRRPVLLTAIAVQAVSLLIFATASGVPALLTARVVQGLSTGAALGAIGAAMLDIDRDLGTFANAVAPGMGTASGVILSALAIRFWTAVFFAGSAIAGGGLINTTRYYGTAVIALAVLALVSLVRNRPAGGPEPAQPQTYDRQACLERSPSPWL